MSQTSSKQNWTKMIAKQSHKKCLIENCVLFFFSWSSKKSDFFMRGLDTHGRNFGNSVVCAIHFLLFVHLDQNVVYTLESVDEFQVKGVVECECKMEGRVVSFFPDDRIA